jgi:predicted outer membrane protein
MRTLVTFAAAVLLAAPALAETNTLAVKDRQFIEKAASGGLAEIKMARLALDKAQSNEVRTFAQRMIDDHSKANDRLKEIATKNGMMLPTSLDSEDQKIYEKLALMSGREFDKQYMKVMKKDHDKDVKDFETRRSRSRMRRCANSPRPRCRRSRSISRWSRAPSSINDQSATRHVGPRGVSITSMPSDLS